MRAIVRGLRSRSYLRQRYWLGQLIEAGRAVIPHLERELQRDYRRQALSF